jgi:predicted nucleotidyltransferase component of viral defense system
MKQIKNLAASIRARLLEIAKETNREFNAILAQFFQERLLYRLSISKFSKKFILKGALLLLVHEASRFRSTKDIDFLGITISKDHESIKNAFKQILLISCDDGIIFDAENIEIEEITKELNYEGIRIKIKGKLENAVNIIQIDIGFGDKIIKGPIEMDFPVFLDLPIPKILVYSKESAIAEKFEAIISLGNITSRMKDFYDLMYYSTNYEYESSTLHEAINTTFKNRETDIDERHYALKSIKETPSKQAQWKAFLSKNKLSSEENIVAVIEKIEAFIEPVITNHDFNAYWDKKGWISNS